MSICFLLLVSKPPVGGEHPMSLPTPWVQEFECPGTVSWMLGASCLVRVLKAGSGETYHSSSLMLPACKAGTPRARVSCCKRKEGCIEKTKIYPIALAAKCLVSAISMIHVQQKWNSSSVMRSFLVWSTISHEIRNNKAMEEAKLLPSKITWWVMSLQLDAPWAIKS